METPYGDVEGDGGTKQKGGRGKAPKKNVGGAAEQGRNDEQETEKGTPGVKKESEDGDGSVDDYESSSQCVGGGW